jgi:ribose 5-phosphate isomerase B
MRIATAADLGGIDLKSEITRRLAEPGPGFHDFGAHDRHNLDYPDYAEKAARAVADRDTARGILACGTGQSMAMTANRVKGIRAALCQDTLGARMSRDRHNANILCLGQRVVGRGLAADIVNGWLDTAFSDEERHHRRVGRIMALDER